MNPYWFFLCFLRHCLYIISWKRDPCFLPGCTVFDACSCQFHMSILLFFSETVINFKFVSYPQRFLILTSWSLTIRTYAYISIISLVYIVLSEKSIAKIAQFLLLFLYIFSLIHPRLIVFSLLLYYNAIKT